MTDTLGQNYLSKGRPAQITVGGGGPSGPAGFTDSFSLEIRTTDSNAAPTDDATFQLNALYADTNDVQTEAVSAGIQGLGDSNDVPTDARSAQIRVWLSGSAGTDVANPANANGQNDGTSAVVSTGVLASNPETMTSALGTNVPSGITFSAAVYHGWFRAQTTLITSTARIIARSTSALFADITMFTQSTLGGDTDHLGGTFIFDLIAAGVDTLAKLQSLQIIHETQDVAAGVTPAILTVDAGAVDITATSI